MLGKAVLLLLSSPICALAQSAADYYVKSLPGQPAGPLLKMHAGYVSFLFFFLFSCNKYDIGCF